MGIRWIWLIVFFFICISCGRQHTKSHKENNTIADFSLIDHRGKLHQLYSYEKSKAVVLFVHGVGCPIVRHSIPTLKELRDSYKKQNITWLMINANIQDERQDIYQEAKKFNIDIPILKDNTQLIASNLGLKRTAEVFIISTNNWQTVYRGPVDDRVGYESPKQNAKNHFLKLALDALLAGKKVHIQPPSVKGCLINMKEVESDRERKISYVNEIVPILKNKCIPCHYEGGIAPWAMTSHKKIKGQAEMIREVILTKRMPPWDADPLYGNFKNNRSLTNKEIKALVHWIDAGTPLTDKEDPLKVQKTKPKWPLGKPDAIIAFPQQKIPATGTVEYINIKIPFSSPKGVWVKAVHIVPQDYEVLHHALIYIQHPSLPPSRKGLDYLAAYVPGAGPEEFPKNTGKWIPQGTVFDIELHYTTKGTKTIDQPKMALYYHSEKPQKAFITKFTINTKFVIPAKTKEHPVQATRTFKKSMVLYSMAPHMHYRGKSMNFEAHYPDGTSEILLSVPNYRFNWQTNYQLTTPKIIPANTKIICRGSFDNSPQNPYNPDAGKEIRWGEQSVDEMFIGFMRCVEK